jgi:hypothetical protein
MGFCLAATIGDSGPVGRLAKLFELNRAGLNVPLAVAAVLILLALLIASYLLGAETYSVTALFAVLVLALSDPGGKFGSGAIRMGVVALIGALWTALAFAVGGDAWEIVVLAALVVTFLSGLAVKFGLHSFVAGMLLNVWFIIALALPNAYKLSGVSTHVWSQTLAWLAGSAVWIAGACIVWLGRGRRPRPQPIAEIPGDTSPRELTRPLILFALIRAVAIGIAVAIPFGFHLPQADWMPIATIVAMKPSLDQSAFTAEQRLAGAALGALVAALFLLTVDNKHVLEALAFILGALGVAIHTVNYALYTAAIAAGVLIALDIPHPTNLAHEALRVLFTFLGVGIAVLVMFLANQLQKRGAKAAPQTA